MDNEVTILVVEDDPVIQALIVESLSDGGFGSIITASGDEAVTLLQSEDSKFRAVVTDIDLRGSMNGWDVGRTAREVDTSMPVVYMTGNHCDEWASKGVPNSLLLAKPFALAQLVTAISNLLNTVTPPAAPTE